MSGHTIRPLADSDRGWVAAWVAEAWGGPFVVTRGQIVYPDQLPGFVAERDGAPIGLLTYRIDGDQLEIVTLESKIERQGIGAALIRAVVDEAGRQGLRRVWLITTNDNTPALRFYEKREFRVVAVHKGAVDESRKLKPAIPLIGVGGVGIHDEIELEIVLSV